MRPKHTWHPVTGDAYKPSPDVPIWRKITSALGRLVLTWAINLGNLRSSTMEKVWVTVLTLIAVIVTAQITSYYLQPIVGAPALIGVLLGVLGWTTLKWVKSISSRKRLREDIEHLNMVLKHKEAHYQEVMGFYKNAKIKSNFSRDDAPSTLEGERHTFS